MSSKWLTYAEAAERAGVDRATIYRWIKADLLHPQLKRIHVEELEKAKRARRKPEAPKPAPSLANLAAELHVPPAALSAALVQLVRGDDGVSHGSCDERTSSV